MTTARARTPSSSSSPGFVLAIAVALLSVAGAGARVGAQEPTPTPTPIASDQPTSEAAASEPAPAEPTLQQQIEELRQKLLVLERKAEIAAEAEAEKAKAGASATASAKDGYSLKSNDGNFTFRLRGYAQLDGRLFSGDEQRPATDTLLLRRVRTTFEGTIYRRFGFRVMSDFGTNATLLQDLFLDWTFSPAAVLRAGKFKPPVGLERLLSASELAFVERALPSNLVPNRDLGVQLGGQVRGGKLEYAVGVFNGVVDGGNVDLDTNSAKDLAARLWLSPWRATPSDLSGLSFGIAASSGQQKGSIAGTTVNSALGPYRTAGQQTFFSYRSDGTAAGTVLADGTRVRISPQASFYRGPFGLLAEYVQSTSNVRRALDTAELTHRSWQVQGVWILTGENAASRWYTPERPFDPDAADDTKRGWGGLAVVARYNEFDLDDDSFPTFANPTSSASEAKGWALGLDWTLQRQIRLLVNYEVTSFEGGDPAGDRSDERVLFTRFQIGW